MTWKVEISRDGRILDHLTKVYAHEDEAKALALRINSKAFQPIFARVMQR
jgi:hypothetical protein